MARKPPEAPREAQRPSSRSRATSYDVARRAGVSQSAVSRAFSTDGSVSDETRRRVIEAATALGYRPNAIARSLITRRSNLVGLVLASSTNAYYPEVATEITRQCASRGSRILLFTFESGEDISGLLEQMWSYQVDGVVACTSLTLAQEKAFEASSVPLVLYNRAPISRYASSVGVDHEEGEGRLVDALWQSGARRFGVIAGPASSSVAQARVRGILRRLTDLGAPDPHIVAGDYTYESGVEGLRELLSAAPEVEAVVCANDAMALGALDAARRGLGRVVPETLSIVGFDGFGAGRWLAYDLATMRQPVERMAEAAVELLFARIEDPTRPAERRTFLADLVAGASARLASTD
ncbi:MAG: LacI family DNA-binding transcriptional regulator [Caulobacterales bacterium]|jgi:DNA-binding LacI/PurR family transcriptional regulator